MHELQARFVLLIVHVGRADIIAAASRAVDRFVSVGITPVFLPDEYERLSADLDLPESARILGQSVSLEDLEVALVLGGDGTILRAAELTRAQKVPILGVNLGHVGFLAESERGELQEAIQHVIDKDYLIEDRVTLTVEVYQNQNKVFETWALNEAAIEKASRERMLELVVEVNGQPVSSYGADGVIISTPTGSTAYAFSAGGPIVWPNLDALLIVPLSAHALFSRPLVTSPSTRIAIELLERNAGTGVIWCDGRRSFELLPGARVEITRSETTVKLARFSGDNFTERLVTKFNLPVSGWRGPGK